MHMPCGMNSSELSSSPRWPSIDALPRARSDSSVRPACAASGVGAARALPPPGGRCKRRQPAANVPGPASGREPGRELQRMDMTGEYRIPAPRQRVWEALNDPEILKAAIPGCEELNKLSDHELDARVKAKVGPVSATFTGKVTLNDLNPPVSYRIAGEGKGGAAGFAKGGAEVNLSEDGTDTILRYNAKADVGGKLAQIGSRLIQGTARKMADDFFGKFSSIVADQHAADAPPPVPSATAAPVPTAEA